MKKRILSVGLAMAMTLTMTGCGSENYTLTTEQNDQVAEFIASTLLERSYEYEWKYTKAKSGESSYLVTGSTSTSTSSSSGTSSSSSTSSTSSDPMTALAEKLQLSNATISYSTYSVGDRYPTGEYVICVPANTGYQVVAVEFNIYNNSSSDITVNSKSSDITLTATIDGQTVNQAVTILKNDISQLSDITIAAGETYTAAALFQLDEASAADINKMSVTVYAGGSSIGSLTIK